MDSLKTVQNKIESSSDRDDQDIAQNSKKM